MKLPMGGALKFICHKFQVHCMLEWRHIRIKGRMRGSHACRDRERGLVMAVMGGPCSCARGAWHDHICFLERFVWGFYSRAQSRWRQGAHTHTPHTRACSCTSWGHTPFTRSHVHTTHMGSRVCMYTCMPYHYVHISTQPRTHTGMGCSQCGRKMIRRTPELLWFSNERGFKIPCLVDVPENAF